jgi:ABC-2 type transport system ATP-binding protein
MSALAIRTRGLTKDFGAVRAVDGLTLEVPAGSVFGFLGPNGAGKTTTIRLLLGLLEPTGGDGEVLGLDIRSQQAEIRQRSGVLLEHSGLYERLTARDNLEFYARVWRLPADTRRERIKTLMDHFGLQDARDVLAGNLSRGTKQKLALARALLHHPPLVFLDEPTAGLDPLAASALRKDLSVLAEDGGVTIFLTTHNLAEAERLCTHLCVIRAGKVVAFGKPEDLLNQSRQVSVEIRGTGFEGAVIEALRRTGEVAECDGEVDRVLLKLRPGGCVAPLVTLLTSQGAQVEEVHKQRASLDEVFMALMQEENP